LDLATPANLRRSMISKTTAAKQPESQQPLEPNRDSPRRGNNRVLDPRRSRFPTFSLQIVCSANSLSRGFGSRVSALPCKLAPFADVAGLRVEPATVQVLDTCTARVGSGWRCASSGVDARRTAMPGPSRIGRERRQLQACGPARRGGASRDRARSQLGTSVRCAIAPPSSRSLACPSARAWVAHRKAGTRLTRSPC
jgi:hypothetical protein